MTYQLDKPVAERLKAFFEPFDFIDKVVIFGSRAKHNANPKSDIDLCIYSLEMSDAQFSKLKLSLDELPILYAIDIVHFEKSNEALRENIERDEKLLFAKYVKITDVCDFQGGSQPPKNEWSDTQLDNYVRMLQIRDFTQGKTKYIQYVKNTKTLKKCGIDDILIGRYGASIGKILTGLEGAYNVALMKITPHENLSREYLFQFLNSSKFQNKISNFSGRAAQAGFNKNDLEDIFIYLPTLTKQKEIAQMLDKASELIELRKASIEKLDELAQSIFIDMFGDPVSNSKGLKTKKLTELTEIKTGKTPSRKEPLYWENGTELWATTTEVNQKYISDTNEKITMLAVAKNNLTVYPKNTILMAMYGQGKTRGKVALLLNESTINQAFCAILPNKSFNTKFLLSLLENSYEDIRSLGRGGNQENLNLDIVKNYEVIYPEIDDQNEFSKKIEKIEAQKSLYESELTGLQATFDALLSQSFEG